MRQELAVVIGAARRQDQQIKWLLWTGAIALALGLLSAPVFARLLPFGLDGQVAAFIMRGDRWHAGEALMQVDSPADWAQLAAAVDLSKANKAALEASRVATAKAKKEQHCTIVVPATYAQFAAGYWKDSYKVPCADMLCRTKTLVAHEF